MNLGRSKFPAILLVLLAAPLTGCRRAQKEPAPAPAATRECQPEIIRPDTSPGRAQFLSWVRANHDDILAGAPVSLDAVDVYIADVDNDGANEYIVATHMGSGDFLDLTVFRPAGNAWTRVDDSPLAEQATEIGHDYRGIDSSESQLLVRFCGRTYVSFSGGEGPDYYPDTYVWEKGAAHPACDTPWLAHERTIFQQLVAAKRDDAARTLLTGVYGSCKTAADPEIARLMQADLSAVEQRIQKRGATDIASTYDFSWVKSEAKEHPDAQIVLDQRFEGLLSAIVPEATLEGGKTLRDALKLSVWLPDPARIVDDRYVILSGCEPHNCGNKGFVWIDTLTRQAIVMTDGTLASKTTELAKVPREFWHQVSLPDDVDMDFFTPSGRKTTIRAPE